MYIPVCHTNGRPVKNTIGVVVNCLVGMGLYTSNISCTRDGALAMAYLQYCTRDNNFYLIDKIIKYEESYKR